jgi:putative ABC transport system permease protein
MSNDLRYAIRLLARRPVFALVVVLTIALGVALTTTAFTVVHGVLLESLPYPDVDRLVYVWEHDVSRGNDRNVVAPANYVAWTEQTTSFSSIAAFGAVSASITGDGEPERVGSIYSTAPLLRMLGAQPLIGRLFEDGEDREGAAPVAILSESLWRRRYGGDATIVGQTIQINSRPTTIIGVLPASFSFEPPIQFGFTGVVDVWTPFRIGEQHRTGAGRYLQVLARLAPGATLERARYEMSQLAARFEREFPRRQTNWGVNVVPIQEQMTGGVSRALFVVFGAVSFVLLIACANVANLLLARATERQQEVAVRAALGASRSRIARQLVADSMTLALLGGGVGLLLANWGLGTLHALAPDIPRLETVSVDLPVFLFASAITLLTGALASAVPTLHLMRSDLATWLRGRGSAGGRREARRTRHALVVVEIALSLVLLVGAGLLTRSLVRLIDRGVGFDAQRLLTATVELPQARYPEEAQRTIFFNNLVERVGTLPGVESASAITFAPLSGIGPATSFWANDRATPLPGERPTAEIRWVHRDFHRTMGIGLERGRSFDATDGSGAPMRVVISQALQREMWPDTDPIGRTLSIAWGDTLAAEVVGVARDIHLYGPSAMPGPVIYMNHEQVQAWNAMTLVVRTVGDPLAVVAQVRSVVGTMDANLPVYDVQTMENRLGHALARARFAAISLGTFAVIALLLALIGIYGVMSYVIGQRMQEFGVRMAMGASRSDLVRLVLHQGLQLVAVAVLLGVAAAIALSRVLQGLVFEVGTTDPLTFVAVVGLLALTALAACWLPARRASRVDPITAMRRE